MFGVGHKPLDQFVGLLGAGGFWLFDLAGFDFCGGVFEIQFQEAFEDLVVGEVGSLVNR
jgi:hypothetical protein